MPGESCSRGKGVRLERENEAGPSFESGSATSLLVKVGRRLTLSHDRLYNESPDTPPFTYRYPRPAVTVDCVVFGIGEGGKASPELQVLLIERRDDPFRGRWALPGGFVMSRMTGPRARASRPPPTASSRRRRAFASTTSSNSAPSGVPGATPAAASSRSRTTPSCDRPRSPDGSDASQARWWPVSAFSKDRGKASPTRSPSITARSCAPRSSALRGKVRYAPVGFHLLPPEFTLTELQRLYEAILGRALDRPNFRRRSSRWAFSPRQAGRRTSRTAPRRCTASIAARTSAPSAAVWTSKCERRPACKAPRSSRWATTRSR